MMGSDDQKVQLPQSVRESLLGSGSGGRMQYRCSFCGKGQDEVQRLIAGPGGVYICDQCVVLCQEIITEEAPQLPAPPIWEAEPFRPVAEMLQDDRFVNEAAKRNLVFQVGHDKRIKVFAELNRQNYIFGVGPRGQSIVYRVVDEDELRDLDRSLSGEPEHEPG